MATVDVIDQRKKSVGSVELKDAVFAAQPNEALVHSAVVMQRASLRQGTASTKGRGEVSGTGKKPWKQKHTGRARSGSNRSPVWRHGGIVFGPRPRSYDFSLPKKMYQAAMQSALSSKKADGSLIVLSEISAPESKTKHIAKTLSQLGLKGTTLLVVGEENQDVLRAARNVKGVKVVYSSELNVYDVLRYESLVVLKNQIAKIHEMWS